MSGTSEEILFSVLIVLIVLSGFFSSSETAMMSLNRYRLKHLSQTGHKGALRAQAMLRRPDRLIGLILIGNNLVNIAASAIATMLALHLYGDAGVAIATVLLTLVILVFSEVTPKTLAAYHPEKVAFPASWILQPLMWLFYPFVWLVNTISTQLVRPFGIRLGHGHDDSLSGDELRSLVGDSATRIPARHQGMLLNVLDLDYVTVEDIMVPRAEIVGIDLNDSDEEIVEALLHSNYTRVPVYEDDINNLIGILHLRKAAQLFIKQKFNKDDIRRLARDPYFIPENTPLHTQLNNFQREKRRIGMVVDEYGVVMGLVALEDILEEIVGEFTSNIADNIDEIRSLDDGSHMIDCAATVREVNKALNWELPTNGPKTLNGLLLEQLESFPDANASVSLGDYCFEIVSIADNKIKAVKASRQTGS